MLEIRYNLDTREITGWCGDPAQFGNLDRGWPTEEIDILDIPIPPKPLEAYLYEDGVLSDNPDYRPPGIYEPFKPLNPAMGVEQRLAHVEQWLQQRG